MSLKDKRKEINYTQDKMARVLEMNVRTYQIIEKSNNCSLKHALKIADFFKCTVEEIFK